MNNLSQTDAIKRKASSGDDPEPKQSNPLNDPHPSKRFHPQSSDDKSASETLPSVYDLIPPSTIKYIYDRPPEGEARADMLQSIFQRVYANKRWRRILDKRFKDIQECEEALKNNQELADLFDDCTKSRNLQELFDSPFLRPPPRSKQSDGVLESELTYFKNAFEKTYHSINPRILLDTMDTYKLTSQPGPNSGLTPNSSSISESLSESYNHSFPIIQSSGMGKSRLVDHSATLRFAIPFNLIEATAPSNRGKSSIFVVLRMKETDSSVGYPPADPDVGDYLALVSSRTALVRYMSFLQTLFTTVVAELQEFTPSTREQVAYQWYERMREGTTPHSTGTYRTWLYQTIIEEARKLEVEVGMTLAEREESLQSAAANLVVRLRILYQESSPMGNCNQFHAFVYFDEAHRLQSTSEDHYIDLMHAIKVIKKASIFFVFLSTNSSLQVSAPAETDYSSSRVRTGGVLNQPFFELPFDCFSHQFSSEAKAAKKLTLAGLCKLEQISKFGRPMWYSHYISVPQTVVSSDDTHPTMELARMKLKDYLFKQSSRKSDKPIKAQLAALGCRILLPFDHSSINSRNMQSSLVESYMRCVFYIPPTREYVWSGYPSEPILSQAAGQLLNDHPKKLIKLAPEIVAYAFRNNLLDRGERAELVAQLLLTIAHDHVIVRNNKQTPFINQPFHSPISLLKLLENLFTTEVWSIVRNAKPFEAHPVDPSLEDKFAGATIFFSYFVQLGDQKSLNMETVFAMFERGAGIKPSAKQPFVDLVFGVVFVESETDEITKDSFTIVQIHVKNKDTSDYVHMESPLAKEVLGYPVLSIVLELEVEKSGGQPHAKVQSIEESVHTLEFDKSTSADLRRRHYVITAYGCTSDTYRCIPKESEVYRTLLAAEKPFQGFPRSENHEMMYEMKSMMFNSDTLNNLSWHC